MDNAAVILVEVGARHGQGAEDAVLAKLWKRFTRHSGDHFGGERIAAIGVEVARARNEVQLLLVKQQSQDLFLGDHVIQAPAGQGQRLPLVTDAARVLEQLAQGNRVFVIRQLRQVFVNLVLQRQLALLFEEHERHGRELFGHRCDVIDGLRRDGNIVLQIGQAVALLVHQLAVLDDGDRGARCAGLAPALEKIIHTFGAVFLREQADGSDGEEDEQFEQRQFLHDGEFAVRKD